VPILPNVYVDAEVVPGRNLAGLRLCPLPPCARLAERARGAGDGNRARTCKNPSEQAFSEEAHTGFEPVLPPNADGKPNAGSGGQIAPGSQLNPHLQAVLERLKERDRERER